MQKKKTPNVYYTFAELKKMYLRGELKPPATDGLWISFYMTEELKAKGTKFLSWAPWSEFVEMVKLDKKQEYNDLW